MERRIGTLPPDHKSVISPILIGRTRQFNSITQRLEESRGHKGTVILILGEAGIGKSRLVNEIKKYAASKGLAVLQGNCFEPDRALPYGPFLDLLRSFILTLSPNQINQEFGSSLEEIIQLIPELANLLPDLAYSPISNPEGEKHRLFQALVQFFVRRLGKIDSQSGLLLIIEDLHWSDETSLEFLEHLVRRIESLPIMLLLTYRSDETSSGLDKLIGALNRQRLALELKLQPLTASEMDALMRAVFELNISLRPELLDTIYALTEGNPFFTEEILKSLIEAGGLFYANGIWDNKPIHELNIPQSIQDAVHRRTMQLSTGARQTLTLAAVAGRRFDFGLLQVLTKINEQDLLEQMKELVSAQLVVEESADQFAFRHALTREAAYARLLLRERKKYHAIIAETIENTHINRLDVHIADLSYHFYEAEVWNKAFKYSQQAGERAQALYAPREAIIYFMRAMVAVQHLEIAPPLNLLRGRGQAYETIGSFEEALNDYKKALEIAGQTQDGNMEWQSLLDIGFLWAGRDYSQAGQWFRRSLDLAQEMVNPQLRAHSLNRIGNWLVNTGRVAEGIQANQEALAIFEALQDDRGIAETFDLLGMANGIYGDTQRAVEQYDRAILLFKALGDHQGLISSLTTRVVYACPSWVETTYSACETPDQCSHDITEAFSLARQVDSSAAKAYVEWNASLTFASFGELGSGLTHARESIRIATEIQHSQWLAGAYFALGRTYLLLLQADLAVQAFSTGIKLAASIGSAWWTGNITAYLARAYLLQGTPSRAEEILKEVMASTQPPVHSPERRVSWAWGELALVDGESQLALTIADRLLASVPGGPKAQPIPWLLKLKGEALGALERWEEALKVLEEARQGALARQERPLLWQIHRALGRQYQRLNQEDLSRNNFSLARAAIESLASTVEDGFLREQFLIAARSTLPREKPVSAGRAAKGAFGGLTPRERQVVMLIAQGKSNREIADALVVTKRTIETHINNILTKLNFTSRTQIVLWAVDRGMVMR